MTIVKVDYCKLTVFVGDQNWQGGTSFGSGLIFRPLLRLRSRHLKVNIMFVGMIIVLADKSIMANGFTSWSVAISNDFKSKWL